MSDAINFIITLLGVKHIFKLVSKFLPAGDQPTAIKELTDGIMRGDRNQLLLGVTGSGKTFTMANVIKNVERPALIMCPNKTLAAQLFQEMRAFFPHNAVEYFVSYYDYYQPEAYIPRSNTYIEKTAKINEEIDRMRHSATRSLLERRDVIVIASVSCIYGIGSIEEYRDLAFSINEGDRIQMAELFRKFSQFQYKRNEMEFARGNFRVRGDKVDLFPAHSDDRAWSISFFGNEIESIYEIDALTGEKLKKAQTIKVFPNSHYVISSPTIKEAIVKIRAELAQRLPDLHSQGKLLEEQRLRERVTYDLETMSATGSCNGIENYSRYLTGRDSGEAPPTLFEYLPRDALCIVDESHVSVPQIRGMYAGDQARKGVLSEFGFRLPSCKDNRPLNFDEWDRMRPSTIFVSATPGPWEISETHGVIVEQIIRPTGLLDPKCTVKKTENQIDDLMAEILSVIKNGGRVIVLTLTKKMAEDLSTYLNDASFKVMYMHCDIDTLERTKIIQDLKSGVHDVLIGINLLREGIDIPQCELVAILDADKEGFLRSKTSLVQIMGRAARHPLGRVILYADKMTESMRYALSETERRRKVQKEYNDANGIVPRQVEYTAVVSKKEERVADTKKSYEQVKKEMLLAARNLEFERAAELRDILKNWK